MPVILQIPTIILPTVSILGTEVEILTDVAEHTSLEFPTKYLQEKIIYIYAQEVALAAVVPTNLSCWVEVSPYPSANNTYWPVPLPTSTAYWAAINGGGGALAPTAPHIEVSGLAGAPGTLVHTFFLPWSIHSDWTRLVIQGAAVVANTSWVIQAIISAKTP